MLLERRPFYWVEHQAYLIAIFVMSLFAPTLLKMTSRLLSERVLQKKAPGAPHGFTRQHYYTLDIPFGPKGSISAAAKGGVLIP